MSGIEVKIVTEGDASIYSRSAQSRLVNAPSSPPLTSKAIQVASGRRKGFQSKNDTNVEKITEKKVSARMPRFEDGELKDTVTRLEPVLIDKDSKLSSSRRRKDARPPINQPLIGDNSNEIQLNSRLEKEYGNQLTQINVSPPLARKLDSARRPPPSNTRPVPSFNTPIVAPNTEESVKKPSSRKSTKPVPKSKVKEPEIHEVEIIGKISPVATRRSPPTSKSKTSKSRSKRDTEKKTKPKDPDDEPKIEIIEEQAEDRYSNRRSERPQSPHRVKTHVKVKGKRVVKKESSDTPSPLSASVTESSTSAEVTSRRKIKSRHAAIEKRISENYEDGEFYPEEDDEHLKFAIKAGLEESRKESIKEAIDAGHELSAEILGHVTRPDAVGEVIENLVSKRREHIRESKRRQSVKSKGKSKTKNEQSSDESSESPRPFKPNRGKQSAIVRETEKESKSKNTSKVKAGNRKAAKPDPPPIEDQESSEEPDIETVEEPKDEASPPMPKSKPKPKITISDGVPKPPLPGNPIGILNNSNNTEETETLVSNQNIKVNDNPKKPSVEKKIDFEDDSDEKESRVKLPRANRKAKAGDLERPDALGQQDSIYDPLNADQPFGDEDDSIGDDKYEESDEDDDKMTINEKKDEMLYRFKLVKEAYPNVALPRITKKMKLAKMVRHYDHVMSRIKLKIKTGNFKIFLVGGFLLMQFGLKKFGLDSSGFALNQMYSMKRYEPFLRQFGESDFSSIGSDLPLMVRLPFFMAVNMGIFMVAKMIFKATGKDVTEQFYKLYAQLTGGDDYFYIKEDGKAGLGGDGEDGGEGGGVMGILKSFMGMFGGGMGGGGSNEDAPKRGEATGATYKRRRPPKKE